ncbi:MAG: heme-copper oxidase subunit III [Myxococcota bacterium]
MKETGQVIGLPETDRDGRLSLGMNLFLLSWAGSFLGLLGCYVFLRVFATEWKPAGAPGIPLLLPSVATFILAVSSVTAQKGLNAVRHARPQELFPLLLATWGLGVLFTVIQFVVWVTLWNAGMSARGTYAGTFYAITIFHALHVVVALGLLGWLARDARRGAFHGRNYIRVTMVTRFWHFLDVSWLLIFLLVYVW